MLPDDLRTGSPGRNIASGHEHADFALPVLDVTLVLRHVEDRQQARERGQEDRDPDVLDTVGHRYLFLTCWALLDELNGLHTEVRRSVARRREQSLGEERGEVSVENAGRTAGVDRVDAGRDPADDVEDGIRATREDRWLVDGKQDDVADLSFQGSAE